MTLLIHALALSLSFLRTRETFFLFLSLVTKLPSCDPGTHPSRGAGFLAKEDAGTTQAGLPTSQQEGRGQDQKTGWRREERGQEYYTILLITC